MNKKSNLVKLLAKGGQITDIQPPDGWQLQTEFGFLRCDDGPSGCLVRLADIVLWLMQRYELPRVAAVQRLIDGLTIEAIGGWLYSASNEAYATIQDASSGFARFIQHEGNKEEKVLYSLLNQIKFNWCDNDAMNDARNQNSKYVNSLAVKFQKAHELWGWGVPIAEKPQADSLEPKPITTYPDLVKFRRANAGAAWTDDMRALLVSEEARRNGLPGTTGVRKALGVELGCSDKRIGELIREHQQAQLKHVTALRRAS